MKALFLLILFLSLFPSQTYAMGRGHGTDPAVVSKVDFNRYAGLWFDIAHAPNFFQKKCLHSTAHYDLISANSVGVYNKCFKAHGETSDISGVATVTDLSVPAKLRVKFNLFAKGDYWIVGLDERYQWAVVSGPRKKSLFILAREAPMDPSLMKTIVGNLKAQGFETENLVYDQY